jgi:ABC-type glycerol-3-phosphate transport system permease component
LPLGATALATISVSNFLGTWNWFLWPLLLIFVFLGRYYVEGAVSFGLKM